METRLGLCFLWLLQAEMSTPPAGSRIAGQGENEEESTAQ
jgi:hypothetical protein